MIHLFSYIKICPKCSETFNVKEVKMSRVTKCPHCKTPIIATLNNTFIAGIFLVIGYGISQVLSSKGIVPFYIPFIIIAFIALFVIEPLTITYKVKD